MTLSQNHMKNELNVRFNAHRNVTGNLNVYSITGEVLLNKQVSLSRGDNKYQIHLNRLDKGIYFVSIELNGFRTNKKIIKL